MGAKKVSIIAKGRYARSVVFRGNKTKTPGGLKKRPDEEQDREDREQEGQRQWQEGLRPHQGLDHGCAEGAQGAWRQRLPGGEEGLAALQEGQGALWPVNTAALDA